MTESGVVTVKRWRRYVDVGERGKLIGLLAGFAVAWFLPVERIRAHRTFLEGLYLVREYAHAHVILCLVPALFIAGAIGQFVRQGAVLRYLGSSAKRPVAYGVASTSGAVLAVCSCTILPLFAGIYRRGAGLGPATAFLYSGPAINVLAIILTARILGADLGMARAIGAIVFAVIIGMTMAFVFRKEERVRGERDDPFARANVEETGRAPWKDALFLATMIAFLVFANWDSPTATDGFFARVHDVKWYLTGLASVALVTMMIRWYESSELNSWVLATWEFTKQIVPLLFIGVVIAGWLMGRPGTDAGLIPTEWVSRGVGGNSIIANLVASVAGAFMYFATLTEVPILETLLGAGMGRGPALTLLLAGPALSLPNMIVIHSYMGARKTVTYVSLVIVMAAITGWLFGYLVA